MRVIIFLAALLPSIVALSQSTKIDSLVQAKTKAKSDTAKLRIEYEIGMNKPILVPSYWDSLATIAKDLGMANLEARGKFNKAYSTQRQGEFRLSISQYEEAFKLYEKLQDKNMLSTIIANMGYSYKKLGNKEKTLELYQRTIELNKVQKDTNGLGLAYNNLGSYHQSEGNLDSAIYYIKLAIETLSEAKTKTKKNNLALAHSNLGAIRGSQGDMELALFHIQKSIDLQEEIGGGIYALNNYRYLANLYQSQEDYVSALKYYNISYEKALENSFPDKVAEGLHDMAIMYKNLNEFGKADSLLSIALQAYENQEIKDGIGMTLNSIATLRIAQQKTSAAIQLFEEAIKISREVNDVSTLTSALLNCADAYLKEGNLQKAKQYGEEGLEKANQVKRLSFIKRGAEVLDAIYAEAGNWKNAHAMSHLFIQMKDSIENINNEKLIARQRIKHEYDLRATADSLKNANDMMLKDAEIKAQDAKLEEESTKQKALIGIVILFVILAGIAFRSYSVKRHDNKIIAEQKSQVEQQKEQLEEKNQEILDSISYAKRIQTAILPPGKIVKEYLSESFILYKPKDIVAGDFYWMEQRDNTVLFAACDCTGHGVPGAMISVVCNNGLNRAVREYGLIKPGKILDKTREIVLEEFQRSEEEVKDGMDVALCALKGNSLSYAGANNPLWIIRHGAEKIEEIKADKQPIGKFDNPLPFTTHQIELNPGDQIYIFSDGYSDQFGGKKGKKFKASNMKELVLSIQSLSMEEQKNALQESFEKWRGDLEQLDDVCVIGVRV